MTDGGGTIQNGIACQPRRRRTGGRPLSAEGCQGRAGAGRRTAAAGSRACEALSSIGDPSRPARGIAVFSISYRLATKTKTFPEAVQDILAGSAIRPRAKPQHSASIRRASGLSAHPPAPILAAARRAFRQKIHRRLSAGRLRVRRSGRQGSGRRLWHLRCRGDVDELSGPGRPREQYPGSSAHRRWRTGRPTSTPRRSATRPSPTTRSVLLLATGTEDDLVGSQGADRPRFSSRSNRPASLCGRASCPARRITG